MASVRSYMYLKYNVNEYLLNEFLTHKDNSQAYIPLLYAWSFFFSTVSTDTATLYSCREEGSYLCHFPTLFYLGVNSLPPSSWEKWDDSESVLHSTSSCQERAGFQGLHTILTTHRVGGNLSHATALKAPIPAWRPWSPTSTLRYLELLAPIRQNCSQGRILQTAILRHERLISVDKFPLHKQSYFQQTRSSQRSGYLLVKCQHP